MVCELQKNSQQAIVFRLDEFKGHKFVDLRLHVRGEGQDAIPTKKGVTVPIHLWPQFRKSLAQVDQALIEQGWLTKADLNCDFSPGWTAVPAWSTEERDPDDQHN